jgi:hypothetical protein
VLRRRALVLLAGAGQQGKALTFPLDEDEDVDGDGCWWWQSTEAKAERWVVPQLEVLAADRGGWRAGMKGLTVNESEVDVC